VSECVGFSDPIDTIDHFRDESFQAINCTGTGTKNTETQHYTHTNHKRYTEKLH